jgi:hypothetical protein
MCKCCSFETIVVAVQQLLLFAVQVVAGMPLLSFEALVVPAAESIVHVAVQIDIELLVCHLPKAISRNSVSSRTARA